MKDFKDFYNKISNHLKPISPIERIPGKNRFKVFQNKKTGKKYVASYNNQGIMTDFKLSGSK